MRRALFAAVMFGALALLGAALAMPRWGGDRIVVCVEDWRLFSPQTRPSLVCAVWRDGRALWSGDRVTGGAPYLRGRIARPEAERLFGTLRQSVAAQGRLGRLDHLGPDSRFTVIDIHVDGTRTRMRSWHELAELSSRVVGTARGIELLQGREREDVLARQPQEYRQFRAEWSGIREAVHRAIPREGRPYSGPLPRCDR